MVAPKMIGLARSPLGFALWNERDFEPQDCEERYIRAFDAQFLLSVIDSLVQGDPLDGEDSMRIEQIRSDLSQSS